MTATERVQRPSESRGVFRRLARRVVLRLWPNQRLRWTREGLDLHRRLARPARGGPPRADQPDPAPGGPGRRPDRRLDLPQRGDAPQARGRSPRPRLRLLGRPAGRRLHLANGRKRTAALAMFLEDDLVPVDRTLSGATTLTPRVFFARVPGRDRARVRWEGKAPRRGKYRFRTMELITRSPFGLLERRVTTGEPRGPDRLPDGRAS